VDWCQPNLANIWISRVSDWSSTWIFGLLALNAQWQRLRAPGLPRAALFAAVAWAVAVAQAVGSRQGGGGACGVRRAMMLVGGTCSPGCLHGPPALPHLHAHAPPQQEPKAPPQSRNSAARHVQTAQQRTANAGRGAVCCLLEPLGQHLDLPDCANTQPVKVSVTAGLGYC
jgi:hypothetical protein